MSGTSTETPHALPRCSECGGPHGSQSWMPRHTPECGRGREQERHAKVFYEVQSGLVEALQERRTDVEFMDRLHRNIAEHGVVLDRLAESGEQTTAP